MSCPRFRIPTNHDYPYTDRHPSDRRLRLRSRLRLLLGAGLLAGMLLGLLLS